MPMSKYSSFDHYLDQATGILKNRLGITTAEELEQAEADFASARSYELGKAPPLPSDATLHWSKLGS